MFANTALGGRNNSWKTNLCTTIRNFTHMRIVISFDWTQSVGTADRAIIWTSNTGFRIVISSIGERQITAVAYIYLLQVYGNSYCDCSGKTLAKNVVLSPAVMCVTEWVNVMIKSLKFSFF